MTFENDHPSNFALESHSAGIAQPGLEAHLESCESCRQVLHELELDQRALMAQQPPASFAREVSAQACQRDPGHRIRRFFTTSWRRLAVAALVSASATTLLFLAFFAVEQPEQLRSMGEEQLTVFLKHGDRIQAIATETRVRAGDALRFQLQLSEPGFVSVFFLDERGHLSWFIPQSADGLPMPVDPGKILLPGSAVFDASAYDERVFVIFRPELFEPEAIALRVATAWRDADVASFADDSWIDKQLELWSLAFHRAP